MFRDEGESIFSDGLDMFENSIKEVTLTDYLNNLLNFDLIKTNVPHDCSSCGNSSKADKLYKIDRLPNSLIINFQYKSKEDSHFIRLTNFMSVDMKTFVGPQYAS